MPRQSITFTRPNDEWLRGQIESEEFSNKSEVINALIRRERNRHEHLESIRAKLIEAEQSGFTDMTRDEILAQSKEELRRNGDL